MDCNQNANYENAGYECNAFFEQPRWLYHKITWWSCGASNIWGSLINLPVGSVAWKFHGNLYDEGRVYIHVGICVARIGPGIFQVEAGNFIGYPADGETYDLRNTGSSHTICIIIGQRLVFGIGNYSKQH